jgi:hypothetical protein
MSQVGKNQITRKVTVHLYIVAVISEVCLKKKKTQYIKKLH